ncbi:unnamed protein product [Prunus armeniaca]|uniref:Uncharacterized protein n=1 Tax=Prunus armeniaca TaxID=36596 RepID=A0A6J5UKM8_PRUAR|nr:unnamed protein product [Prunus armeniaca]
MSILWLFLPPNHIVRYTWSQVHIGVNNLGLCAVELVRLMTRCGWSVGSVATPNQGVVGLGLVRGLAMILVNQQCLFCVELVRLMTRCGWSVRSVATPNQGVVGLGLVRGLAMILANQQCLFWGSFSHLTTRGAKSTSVLIIWKFENSGCTVA